jgi:translation initiation factor 3 subunit I
MVMKGHERNITRVVFNRDGDLLFSAASDKTPTVWDTETGERLGTYNGHSGSITDMSVSCALGRVMWCGVCRAWCID